MLKFPPVIAAIYMYNGFHARRPWAIKNLYKIATGFMPNDFPTLAQLTIGGGSKTKLSESLKLRTTANSTFSYYSKGSKDPHLYHFDVTKTYNRV